MAESTLMLSATGNQPLLLLLLLLLLLQLLL
jgi:hypothetical protein